MFAGSRLMASLVREFPAAEEAHQHTRSGGGVGFLAPHGIEQRLARVLARPDRGEPEDTMSQLS